MSNSGRHVSTQADWLDVVRQQVESIRFGVVQIVVHDSRVVQIERTEKVRLADLASRDNGDAKPKTAGLHSTHNLLQD